MSFTVAYLKQRAPVIILFLSFAIVFETVFILFDLPTSAVAYPFFICLIIALIALAADFFFVRKRHEELTYIKNGSVETQPVPKKTNSITENDMCDIIAEFGRQYAVEKSSSEERFKKTSDYYTLWAHQIKTPISSMYLTLYSEDSPESRRLISDLSRIERYVDMALSYLKLDSDTNDLVLKHCFLDDLIKKSVKSFSTEFIYRKLSLECEETGKELITDEKWLCFVLCQLISNALKYTNEGGIKIYMSDENILCIEDTGIGISPDDLPRIFECGYTGQNGRTDKRASGIGLYLCRRICNMLHIKLSAESTPDVGTRVYLDLSQYKFTSE